MRVFIAGIDGYLGWSLALHLTQRGHDVGGADLFLRRQWVEEVGSHSAIPIADPATRLNAFREHYGCELSVQVGDFQDYAFVRDALRAFRPHAVVHLGEMPSAPYSMIDAQHAAFTQQNNVVGSLNILWAMREVCPDAHLVKLGTMGEYGTPNIDIPEGFFEVEFRGRREVLPFPRQAGSFYHLSKVHDSHNTMLACRIWGLRSTDIMQGVVFGTQIDAMRADPRLNTRLDFDQCFGTAVNRFCCQVVIGHPVTLFGSGHQKRGFLPLRDSMQCLTLTLENPPEPGEYRVFNQFEETYSLLELAHMVRDVSLELGHPADVLNYDNPRSELHEHYYQPDRQHLLDLGYVPTHDVRAEMRLMLHDLAPHQARILQKVDALIPDIRWDGTRRRSRVMTEHIQP